MTSNIALSNLSGQLLELVISNIAECLTVASRFEGRVFGGYVRDVAVPRLIDPKGEVKFSDVDIWFTTKDKAEMFVAAMDNTLLVNPNTHLGTTKFDTKRYNLYCGNTCITYVDLVVSPQLPVDDFDVNTYVVEYRNKMPHNCDHLHQLIAQCKTKQCHMLSQYFDLLNQPSTSEFHYARVRKLMDQGWKIILPDTQSPMENIDGSSEFFTYNWLRTRQKCTTVAPGNKNFPTLMTLCTNPMSVFNIALDRLKTMNCL